MAHESSQITVFGATEISIRGKLIYIFIFLNVALEG